MKKRNIFFFLALLCLFGKDLYGQEVAGHPPVPSAAEGAPVVVYGTVRADHEPDPIELTLFQFYTFNSRYAPGAQNVTLDYRQGNMMEGRTPNEKIFEYTFTDLKNLAYLSLSFGNDHSFLDRFAVLPGDTIEIYIDRRFSAIYFAGNASERMELQHNIALLDSREKIFRQPVMVSAAPEKILADPRFAERYEAHGKNGLRRMVFIEPGEGEINRLKSNYPLEEDLLTIQKMDLVMNSGLDDGLKAVLTDNITASRFSSYLTLVNGTFQSANLRRDSVQLDRLKELIRNRMQENITTLLGKTWHPDAIGPVDLFSQWANLVRKVEDISRYEAILQITSPQIRDRVAVDYFYNQYEFEDNAQIQLEDYLNYTADPFGERVLQNLLALRKEGSKLKYFEFMDESGHLYDTGKLLGKVTLLDFYIGGCGASKGFFEKAVLPLVQHYGDREDFQVITVSADRDETLWKESIQTGYYTSSSTVNLFTNDMAHAHPFLVNYGISGFPSKMVIGSDGRILKSAGIPGSYEALKNIIDRALNRSDQTYH
ncbi:TlpA family protein disulfide reductase [Anditalea andensis]|uniref:Thioredoxin domain-containing protein n=1 Tax=Anditalea andensis TaxID=1048983 RepID=A0A074KNW4_9BACT|nr:thioredoxin family protein [Anditalea andensis]KEO71601.1 hypothetical protein EL17_24130 [Anditalea andensis]